MNTHNVSFVTRSTIFQVGIKVGRDQLGLLVRVQINTDLLRSAEDLHGHIETWHWLIKQHGGLTIDQRADGNLGI